MTLAYSKSVVGAWYEDDGSQELWSGILIKHFSPVYSLVQCYTWNTKLQSLIDQQLKKMLFIYFKLRCVHFIFIFLISLNSLPIYISGA